MENDAINGNGAGTQIASQQQAGPSQQQQQVMASLFSNMLTRFMDAANENANNG
ncbi:MAG: hypothetical protein AAF441_05355 [Pseudomonadota bacterium]